MKPGSVNIFTPKVANAMEDQNAPALSNLRDDSDEKDRPPEENPSVQEEIPREDKRTETIQANYTELARELEDDNTEGARKLRRAMSKRPKELHPRRKTIAKMKKIAPLRT